MCFCLQKDQIICPFSFLAEFSEYLTFTAWKIRKVRVVEYPTVRHKDDAEWNKSKRIRYYERTKNFVNTQRKSHKASFFNPLEANIWYFKMRVLYYIGWMRKIKKVKYKLLHIGSWVSCDCTLPPWFLCGKI